MAWNLFDLNDQPDLLGTHPQHRHIGGGASLLTGFLKIPLTDLGLVPGDSAVAPRAPVSSAQFRLDAARSTLGDQHDMIKRSKSVAGPHGTIAAGPIFDPSIITSPSQTEQVAFINGIDSTGAIVGTSFFAWNGDDPATYNATQGGASKWGGATAGTAGGTVHYYFAPDSNWTGLEQQVFEACLTLWSDEANIQFAETTSAAAAEITFTRGTDGSAYTSGATTGTGSAGQIGSHTLLQITDQTISIDTGVPGFGPIDGLFTTSLGYVWQTIVHELGHALGLGHGGAYNGDVDPTTQQYSAYDTRLWSIMSYIDPGSTALYDAQYPVTGTNWHNYVSETPMALDIQAIQQLYGAPTTTALSGGQVFGFNCNITDASRMFFDFTVNTTPVVTLYDRGTGNTLDLSGFSNNSIVDLTPGSFSSCAGLINNVCIASNTLISTAIGGIGNDSITANNNGDTLFGGGGTDTLTGGSGNDILNGGPGNDRLIGGDGKDTASFSNATSAVAACIGSATGLSTGSDVLMSIENLTGSPYADTLTGNNAVNVIRGGAGNDTIGGQTSGGVALTSVGSADLTHGNTLVNGLGGAAGFGENRLRYDDDVSSAAIDLTSIFGPSGINFFGTSYTTIYINTNGNVTFGDSYTSGHPWSAMATAPMPMIAPYWTDIDTRAVGTASPGGTSTGTNAVWYDLDRTNGVFTVTWDDVGAYDRHDSPVCAFQLQLVSEGSGNFDMVFRYETIGWTIGDAYADLPCAGYYADASHSYDLPQSGDAAALLNLPSTAGNTGIAGVWVFHYAANAQTGTGDQLFGDDGDDAITGSPGNDTLNGGNGNDGLRPGLGNDSVVGGNGNDTINFSAGQLNAADRVDGGAGTDLVVLSSNYTGANAVVMNATTMVNVETLRVSAGNSYSLTTNDATVAPGQRLTVDGSALGASNKLTFNGAAETDGSFSITAGAAADDLTGGSGNDVLNGGAGADTMRGGTGDDGYYVDNAGDVVIELASGGNDVVRTTLASYTLGDNVESLSFVGSGAFTGNGNALNNIINGGSGNDTLNGQTGGDTMRGGSGDDGYYVDSTADVVTEYAGSGTDVVRTTLASYTLGDNVENLSFIGPGAFVGNGNALNNIINGGSGNDRLDGKAGADTMRGGAGDDGYYVDDAGDVVVENAGAGNDVVRTTLASCTLSANVESLSFTGVGNFTGNGNALDNIINGGSGNDTLDGKAGADMMRGGAGDDAYYVDNAGDVVTEGANAGNDVVRTTLASYSLGSNVEYLTFTGSGDFTGSGNALDNIINGGSGNDTIRGAGGADRLNGGAGGDTFVYTAAADSMGSDYDNLVGFDAAVDKIDTWTTISGIDAAITTGTLSSDSFDGDLTTALGGNLNASHAILFTPNAGTLSGHQFLVVDTNATGGYQAGADLVFELASATNLGSLVVGTFT